MTKYRKKFIVTLGITLICVPIVVNYLCLTVFPAPIIGDGKLWLTFWGSFIGGIIPVLAAIYVLDEEHKKDCYRKEYEIQKECFNSLCVDMGKLCSTIDMNILCFYLMNMTKIDDAKKMIQEIGKLEKAFSCEYNEFCLKHAHNIGEEGKEFIDTYWDYSKSISSHISIVQNAVIERQTGKITDITYYSLIGRTCKELEELGDIRTKLLILAQKWKKREWNYTENLRNIYVNG